MGRRARRRLLTIGAALAGAWLAARFLLPWCAPFLLGFALAALIEPLVRALVRRGWPRSAAATCVSKIGEGMQPMSYRIISMS